MPETGPWKEWSQHVLSELERLNTCYDKLADTQQTILTEIAMLKVKAGIWGAVGGVIPALAVLIYFMLGGKK